MAFGLVWPSIAVGADPPAIQGQAALLMDGATGQVLWHVRGYDRMYPASTTKMLTGLVAVEHGRLDQIIVVSPNVTSVQGWDSSSCYINVGESQTLEALLYGLMLSSGNDCAVAIAEGLTNGHPDQFITWMNEKARELGATRSHFVNPSGLHDDNHYTTAYDLAQILKAAVANEALQPIISTKSFVMPGHQQDGEHWNTNQLLTEYEGTVGGKTGFTEEAGFTLISAAERNGTLLLGVVMNNELSSQTYQDMIQLLDHGFSGLRKTSLIVAGEPVSSVPVTQGAKDSVMAVTREPFDTLLYGDATQAHQIERTVELVPEVQAPVQKGQELGTLTLKQNGQFLGSVPLVADEEIEQVLTAWARTEPLLNEASGWLMGMVGKASGWVKWILYGLGGLLLFRTVVLFIRRRVLRRRRRHIRVRRDDRLPMYRTRGRQL